MCAAELAREGELEVLEPVDDLRFEAISGARIVEAVLRDEHAVMPVSSTLRDYRGISGIALSVPCVVGAHGIERVLDTPMDEHEAGWLDQSASTLHDSLKSLGLE